MKYPRKVCTANSITGAPWNDINQDTSISDIDAGIRAFIYEYSMYIIVTGEATDTSSCKLPLNPGTSFLACCDQMLRWPRGASQSLSANSEALHDSDFITVVSTDVLPGNDSGVTAYWAKVRLPLAPTPDPGPRLCNILCIPSFYYCSSRVPSAASRVFQYSVRPPQRCHGVGILNRVLPLSECYQKAFLETGNLTNPELTSNVTELCENASRYQQAADNIIRECLGGNINETCVATAEQYVYDSCFMLVRVPVPNIWLWSVIAGAKGGCYRWLQPCTNYSY
jgi:hypothetical protein